MSLSSAHELFQVMRHLQLIDAGRLDDLERELQRTPAPFADAQSLTDTLVTRDWLTSYQQTQLLLRKGRELVLGPYRMLEPLGEGGMGQVFKAFHQRLSRLVALKMIRRELLSKQPDAVRRFQREARAVAQLLHPNVVVLYDADEVDGTHFLAMEYVDGIDLAHMVQQQGALSIPQACDFIRQAALGLQHAFECGIVHRDIKPGNLLVTRSSAGKSARPSGSRRTTNDEHSSNNLVPRSVGGVVKILDMGLVRLTESLSDQSAMSALTQQGSVIGTPDFIAPEQARDATKVDIRADIYSLGCTFYFLLTGRPPFPFGSAVEKLVKHQNETPRALEEIRRDVPADVRMIVQRMMSKRPDSRFQTPAEVVEAIQLLNTTPAFGPHGDDTGYVGGTTVPLTPAGSGRLMSATQAFSPASLVLSAKRLAEMEGHKGYVMSLAFSQDGGLLASGGVDATVRLWDISSPLPAELACLTENLGEKLGEVSAIAFAPDSSYLVTGSISIGGAQLRWDLNEAGEWVQRKFPGQRWPTDALAFSPDGNFVLAGSGNMVRVWAIDGRTIKSPTVLKGHSGRIKSVAFANDNRRFISAGDDTTIRLWEIGRFWGASQKTVYPGHTDSISSVSFSPDGRFIASGSKDGSIRLWDGSGTTNRPLDVFGQENPIRTIRFTPNGRLLVSIVDSGRVYLWDIHGRNQVQEWLLDQRFHTVALSASGRYLAVGTGDGRVYLLDLEIGIGAPVVAGS